MGLGVGVGVELGLGLASSMFSMTSHLLSCDVTIVWYVAKCRSMLATTPAKLGRSVPGGAWYTSAPNTIVGVSWLGSGLGLGLGLGLGHRRGVAGRGRGVAGRGRGVAGRLHEGAPHRAGVDVLAAKL